MSARRFAGAAAVTCVMLAAAPVWAAPAKRAPAKPAAVPAAPAAAPAADSARARYASEEGLRRYLSARLLEQSGKLSDALAEYYRALSFDPTSVELMLRISEVCAHLGDPRRSLEFAERALQLAPDEPRALWLQGAARFSSGDAAGALAPLERACALDSTQAEVLRTTARVAESLERADVAERAWRRLVWVDEEDGEAWFQIAAMEARRGDFAAARRSLDRATELNPTRPGLLFLEGWVLENLGDAAGAIERYQHHLQVHLEDLATRRRLVGLYMRSNRIAEAYAEARRVSELSPEDADALQVEADLAFRTKHPAEGDRALARLRALAPHDAENAARAVVVMSRNGRAREAAKLADDWSKAHPRDPAGPVLAVRAWSAAGVPDTAVARAQRALAMAPDSLEPRRLLARALTDARRFAEAEREYLLLRDRLPEEPGVLLDLGSCRERAGNIDGAVAAGRSALKLAPDWAPAQNFLGYVLADHDRELHEAKQLIERALAQDPDNGAYIDSYGWVLYRLKDFAGARAQLEKAVPLTGGDAVVREHLGDVYRALGMVDAAREQYRLSAEAGGETGKRVGEKLRALR